MPSMTQALAGSYFANQAYQQTVQQNNLPPGWNNKPVTLPLIKQQIDDLYKRVNLMPQTTVKFQKAVEAKANVVESIISAVLGLFGLAAQGSSKPIRSEPFHFPDSFKFLGGEPAVTEAAEKLAANSGKLLEKLAENAPKVLETVHIP